MKRVNNLDEVMIGSNYIDCYVSTDESEVASILNVLGYNETKMRVEGGRVITPLENKTGLTIECMGVPLDDVMKKSKDVGFTPMSYFRVRVRGNSIKRELVSILTALNSERQNMAFVNENYTKAFVKLSEFYTMSGTELRYRKYC